MKKIIYELDKNGWSKTQCPHTRVILRVGSLCCQRCKYHLVQYEREQCVECLCEDGEILAEFPDNMNN